jgi:sec-independent protein translocase protein TatA
MTSSRFPGRKKTIPHPHMQLATLLNLGGPDVLIILAIVLFLFGGKKLPELARGLGEAMREFTKAKDEHE